MSDPFKYPTTKHLRRHGPDGCSVEIYKRWLRDEFTFRCVLCLWRERWRKPWHGGFHVISFTPRNSTPSPATARTEYESLLLVCGGCYGVLPKNHVQLPDPCLVSMVALLEVAEDGGIRSCNQEGERLIQLLRLGNEQLKAERAELIRKVSSSHEERLRQMGFPDDMPNLAAPPHPPRNLIPNSEANSWHAQRLAGSLPKFY